MTEQANGTLVIQGRLYREALFEPRDYKGDKNFKYKATILVPKDTPEGKVTIKKIAAANEAIKLEKWPKKVDANGKSTMKIPKDPKSSYLIDGDESNDENHHGHYVVTAIEKAENAPTLYDANPKIELTKANGGTSKIYRGAVVNVKLNVWAQDNDYGQGMRANLLGVQFVKHGEAFGGGRAQVSASDFEDLSDSADVQENEDAMDL